MKKILFGSGIATLVFTLAANFAFAAGGFDKYGYNDGARIFNGTGESWSLAKGLPADYLGDYAKDKLIMKWNAQWDNCNAHGNVDPVYCLGATLTNEWNGKVPGGSGDTEHFKAIWVGPLGESSPYWQQGGQLIWGNYETIMDQGLVDGVHTVWTRAIPAGFGVSK